MEQTQYNDLKTRVDEIHAALIGNPIAKDGGMISRLKAVEEKTDNHGKFISRLKWSGGLLVGIATVLGYLFEKFTSLFHTSNH
jgi:preprotein translocase subunit SecY